jgi:hypothetical protein
MIGTIITYDSDKTRSTDGIEKFGWERLIRKIGERIKMENMIVFLKKIFKNKTLQNCSIEVHTKHQERLCKVKNMWNRINYI